MSLILGIESSCDETAAALVAGDRRILAHRLAGQEAAHRPYGGVVPEIAARAHVEILPGLIRQVLAEADVAIGEVDAIAATAGPGLIGGVMVALLAGKGLSLATGRPLVAVNHLEGHALSPRLVDPDLDFPYLLLLASGGHCQLLEVRGVGDYARLATTIDDAAGEAFDKAAKLLGLGYPGGRAIEEAARGGNSDAMTLPRPRVKGAALDLSFSGLKTALWQGLEKAPGLPLADVAASFQRAIVESLVEATRRAIAGTGALRLVVTGGVSANGALREAMARLAAEEGATLLVPPLKRCTDNAAMIAYAGWLRLKRGECDPLTLNAVAELPLGPRRTLGDARV